MAFELNNRAAKETFTLQLTDPATEAPLWADDEETLPVTVSIFGKSSKQYRAAIAKLQNAQFQRGKQKLTAEQLRADGTALLVACSDKTANLMLDCKTVETPEDFHKLYSNPQFDWLRQQVDSKIEDVAAFM